MEDIEDSTRICLENAVHNDKRANKGVGRREVKKGGCEIGRTTLRMCESKKIKSSHHNTKQPNKQAEHLLGKRKYQIRRRAEIADRERVQILRSNAATQEGGDLVEGKGVGLDLVDGEGKKRSEE